MSELEKFPLTSMNITEEQKKKLKQLFPEVFTEGDKIDWDKLRLTLGESVDVGKERFGMNWPGKADCFKIIQQPSLATLVPARDESVNFDTTGNLFIEGDNLEVLKLLQKSYLGKIKMIYIDPPYNTGNDFIYPDNYSETLETYLAYTGQVDSEGRKFSTNTDTEGRFHSKWMNMMYPRLFLAKNLLKDEGVIFISIDDNEVENLKKLCGEIFGEENFISQNIRITNSAKNTSVFTSVTHDYTLIYGKNISVLRQKNINWKVPKNNLPEFLAHVRRLIKSDLPSEDISAELRELTKYPRFYEFDHYYYIDDKFDKLGPYASDKPGPSKGGKGYQEYSIPHPITKKLCKVPSTGWAMPKEKAYQMLSEDRWHFGEDENTIPRPKAYLFEKSMSKVTGVHFFDSQKDVKFLNKMGVFFDFPKPLDYLKILFSLSDKDSIVLDFFAGSCSTAHTVLELNKENDCKRKFICVQLPELTEVNGEAFNNGFKTIADIGKERIRRVIKKLEVDNIHTENTDLFKEVKPNSDLGFKIFKLAPSNFSSWDTNVDKTAEAISKQLELHINHISESADQEAILYELLLKSGFELTTKIEKLEIEGKTVFSIGEGELIICLERKLTNELIKAMAERKPARVICLDEGFQNNDQLKTNAALIMKSKGVVKFQTV